jgi:hypothetical protein
MADTLDFASETSNQLLPNLASNGGNVVSGTFQPHGRHLLLYNMLDTTPPAAILSSFNGVDPNGETALSVADVSDGDLHQLQSWGLDVAVVPEPEFPSLGCTAAICLGTLGRWRGMGCSPQQPRSRTGPPTESAPR